MRRLYVPLFILISTATAQQSPDQAPLVPPEGPSEDYLDRSQDGSYKFGYRNYDYGSHYHTVAASRDNTVAGSFGSRDPASRHVVQTTYTAGNRGFRARGPNIARQMDLSQAKIPYQSPVPPDSPNYQPTYKGYHDPNEDASYKFTLKTPTYSRGESSDSKGTVNGAFSYIDDVGKRHDVQYEAGSQTGFHVKNAFPDSEPYRGLFYQGPNKPGTPLRGHSSIIQNTDGAYQFTASGPDQKRIEVSDSTGRVRGSYTYIDDKGVQRTVQYVAGPNIGYKVIRKGTGPIYPPIYPFPNSDFLSPPLPPESALSDVSTTTTPSSFANDLFEANPDSFGIDIPTPDDSKPFEPSNDFLSATNKPSSTTSSYHPDSPIERSNFWNTPSSKSFQSTLKPPKPDAADFFTSFNTYKPADNSPSSPSGSGYPSAPGNSGSSKYFNDIFDDKDNNANDFKSHNSEKNPSNAYLYPKLDKSFNTEPERASLERNRNENHRYSETSGNFLGFPPGVAIRAHVQSLDILPYGAKVPPPEETLRRHEQLHRDRRRRGGQYLYDL